MKTIRNLSSLFAAIGVLSIPFAVTSSAQAQVTQTKTNTAGALNAPGSYVSGTAPGSGDIILFNNTITAAQADTLGGSLTLDEIQVTNPTAGANITIGSDTSAYTLTLNGLASNIFSTYAATPVNIGIDMSAATVNLTYGGANDSLAIGNAQSWLVNTGRTLTINGAISGSANVSIAGGGTVTLGTTADTYTGNYIVGSGTTLNLQIGQSSTAGFILNGGTLTGNQALSSTNFVYASTGTSTFSDTGSSAAVLPLFAGNGNLSMTESITSATFGGATSTFANFGGTVLFGSSSPGFRLESSTGNSDSVNPFANFDFGTGSGGISVRNGTAQVILGGIQNGTATANLGGAASSGGHDNLYMVGSANLTQTFNGIFTNGSSVGTSWVKTGFGTLTLTGLSTNNDSSYYQSPAANNVAGGTLQLTYSTNANNILASTSSIGLSQGGKLSLTGNASGTTQTFTGTAVNPGGGSIVVNPNGGTTTLTLGAINVGLDAGGVALTGGSANGSTLNISTTGTGTANITTTTAVGTDGTFGGRITYGTNWATTTSGSSPYTLSGLSTYAAFVGAGGVASGASSDYLLTDSGTVTASESFNSLKIATSSGGTFNMGGFTLTLTDGGLLFAGANAESIGASVGDGTLKSGIATNSDLIIQQLGSGVLTINSVIANGNGAQALTIAGGGSVVLAGTNTYTGATFLNGAGTTATVTSDANLGAVATGAALNLDGGTLLANATFGLYNGTAGTNNRNVVIGGSGGTVDVTSSNTLTVAGVVSDVTINGTNDTFGTYGALTKTDTGTLVLSNAANTYSGATIINGGVLSVGTLATGNNNSSIGSAPSTANALVLNGGTLKYTGLAVTTDRTFTIGQNGGGIDNEGSGALNLSSPLGEVSSGSGNRTMAFTANSASGANTFAGAISDPTSWGGTGTTAVTVNGPGAWTFSGANTYTGGTTIQSGATLTASTVGNGYNLASGVTTLNNGTLNLTYASGQTVASGSSFNFGAGGGTMKLSGEFVLGTANQLTGSGAFALTGASVPEALWVQQTNTYSGAATVGSNGIMELGTTNTLAASSITVNSGGQLSEDNNQNTPVTLNGGTLDANDSANSVPTLTQSGAVTLNASTNDTISLNPWYSTTQAETFTISNAIGGSGNLAVTSTASGAILNLSGTNTYTGNTTIGTSGTAGDATVNITGTGSLNSGNYAGAITNYGTLNYNSSASQTLSGAITGTGALNVGGTGTVTLSNASNTFSGGSTVNGGGTLLLNGSGTGGNVSVGVASAGTLGGTGTVTGVVSVGAHGTITPGLSQAATGTLSVGSLTFSSGGTGDFYVNTSNASSLIAVTTSGGLTLTGGVIDPFNAGTANPANILGTYDLINYSGSDVGSLTTVAAPAGFSYALTDTGSQIDLTITATVSPNIWNVAGNTGGDWNNVGGTVQNWSTGTATNGPTNAGTAVTLGIGTTNASTGGPVNISSNVTIGSLTFDNANSYTLSATTGQSLTLDNSGSNSVISLLTGSHTISAAVVVNNPGTTISVVSGQKLTLSGNVSGTGTVTVNGPGTTLLSGTNSYGPAAGTVGTIFNSGTLQVGGNSALSTGDVSITGNNLLQSVAAGLTLANNFIITGGTTTTFGTNGNVFTLTGNITDGGTGTGAMTVASAVPGGTLILTGTGNTNGGAITINANTTLQIGNGTTGSIGTGAISNSGAFVDDSSSTIAPGAISGGGTVTQNGSGTLTLAGTNGYTGATSATAGTISLTGSLTGTPSVTTSGTGIVSETSTGSISGTGTTFTQGSSGTSTLGGANTYTGATSATAGTINLTTGSLTGSNVSTSGTGNFSEQSAGVIAGTGVTFTQGSSGTSTLGGTNTFTGATSITAGSLVVAGTGLALQDSTVTYSAGSLSFSGTTTATFGALSGSSNLALTNAASGAVTLTTGGDNASTTFSGNLTSNGSLIKTGTGTMILSGANTYTGATSVNAGVLTLTNALGTSGAYSGAISANPGGTLNLNSATVYAASMSANNVNNATTYALINITGTSAVTLSGNLFSGGGNGTQDSLVSLTGGTLSAASVSVGRGFANYGSGVLAGSATEGIYVNGGALTDTGTLVLSGANSSANMRMDSGSVTVSGTTTISNNTDNRVGLLDINGGTFTSNDATTNGGIVIGGTGFNYGELLVRNGTLTTKTITMGGSAQTAGVDIFDDIGGTTTIGSGGIVTLGTGETQSVNLGSNTVATTPILAQSATWSTSVPFALQNSSGSVAPTIQTGSAPTGGTPYDMTLSGPITGTGGINKTGSGSLILTNTGNTYSGVTTINAGTVQISGLKNIGGLSYNSVTFNGGTLQYTAGASGAGSQDITTNGSSAPTINAGGGTIDTNGNTIEYANTIGHSGTGGLTLNDSNGTPGSLILDAVNTYTGTTTIARGTLVLNLSGANVLGSSSGVNLTSASSVLDITGTGSAATLAFSPVAGSQTINDLTGVAGSLIDLGSFALTAGTANSTVFAGVIQDGTSGSGGSFVKQGAGTITLTGANTYTGGTTISAGALQVGNGGTTGNLGTGGVTDNGSLVYDRSNNLTSTNLISGTGSVTQAGTGATTFTLANAYKGGTTIKAGTLYVNNTSGSGTGTGNISVGSGDIANSGTLAGSGKIGNVTTTTTVSVSGGGTISSGPVQANSPVGTVTGTGLTFTNTTINVSGDAPAILSFALGTNTTGGTGIYTFDNPSLNSTYMTLTGGSTLNFAGVDAISLTDLTTGSLALRQNVPYLLVSGTAGDITGLVTQQGYGASATLSLDGNGFVLGVWAGGSNPLTDYTPIAINQYGADGVTPLTGSNAYYDTTLYLENGNLEVVPEPGTWALMLGGLAALVLIRRTRRNNI